MECLPGLTSSSLTTCWTLGTCLASFSASFFCSRVFTEPVRTRVPFLAEPLMLWSWRFLCYLISALKLFSMAVSRLDAAEPA